MPAVDAPVTLAVLVVGYLVLVHLGFRALEQRRELTGIPRSATRGVHLGLNRVQGYARPLEAALVSPMTGTECVAWSYRVEDEWRRASMLRWRRRPRWRIVEEETTEDDFDLVDDSGSIRIRIAGAVITGWRTSSRRLDPSDPEYSLVASGVDLTGATGRRRLTELVIPLASPTTVVGTARLRDDVPLPELAWGDHDRRLMLSCVGITVGAARHLVTAAGFVLAAVGLLAIAPLVIRPSDTEYWQAVDESGGWIPVLLLYAGLLAGAYWLRYVYNDLVRLRERVARARSLIAVELQRRHDLLPALAAVVTEAEQHEHQALVDSAAARVPVDDPVAALAEIDGTDARVVEGLIAVAEKSPDLKASESYEQVQTAIVATEDRLALVREFYNDSVTLYNDRQGEMPTSLVARLFRFPAADLYRSDVVTGDGG